MYLCWCLEIPFFWNLSFEAGFSVGFIMNPKYPDSNLSSFLGWNPHKLYISSWETLPVP